jgi:hypothetical protein
MPGDRPAHKHRVTQAEGAGGAAPARPKNLGFMVGWLVFLGVYQIFLAWKFGTFFEGSKGDLRHYFGGAAMEPLYAAIGVTALIVAWGGWRLRPWAYRASFVLQGLVYLVVIAGIVLWLAGKSAPAGWLLLDAAFGAYNLWWLLQPGTRKAFARQEDSR